MNVAAFDLRRAGADNKRVSSHCSVSSQAPHNVRTMSSLHDFVRIQLATCNAPPVKSAVLS
eukprot:5658791-Prymnesium_polylepis.1